MTNEDYGSCINYKGDRSGSSTIFRTTQEGYSTCICRGSPRELTETTKTPQGMPLPKCIDKVSLL